MIKSLIQPFKTYEFINSYPGLTQEEQGVLSGLKNKLEAREKIVRSGIMTTSTPFTMYIAVYIYKKRPPKHQALKIAVFFPLMTLSLSYLFPYLDFFRTSSEYEQVLLSSSLSSRFRSYTNYEDR